MELTPIFLLSLLSVRMISANQRPVLWSRDLSGPMRGHVMVTSDQARSTKCPSLFLQKPNKTIEYLTLTSPEYFTQYQLLSSPHTYIYTNLLKTAD